MTNPLKVAREHVNTRGVQTVVIVAAIIRHGLSNVGQQVEGQSAQQSNSPSCDFFTRSHTLGGGLRGGMRENQ